jgi:hypothetical protein
VATGNNDEEEFPRQNFILGRSIDEDYRHIAIDPRQAAVWSARDFTYRDRQPRRTATIACDGGKRGWVGGRLLGQRRGVTDDRGEEAAISGSTQ